MKRIPLRHFGKVSRCCRKFPYRLQACITVHATCICANRVCCTARRPRAAYTKPACIYAHNPLEPIECSRHATSSRHPEPRDEAKTLLQTPSPEPKTKTPRSRDIERRLEPGDRLVRMRAGLQDLWFIAATVKQVILRATKPLLAAKSRDIRPEQYELYDTSINRTPRGPPACRPAVGPAPCAGRRAAERGPSSGEGGLRCGSVRVGVGGVRSSWKEWILVSSDSKWTWS